LILRFVHDDLARVVEAYPETEEDRVWASRLRGPVRFNRHRGAVVIPEFASGILRGAPGGRPILDNLQTPREPSDPLALLECPFFTRLYPFQQEAVNRMVDPGGFGLWLDCGLGKGLEPSTPIITPKGSIPIGQLRRGDLVLGSDGKPYPVTGVFPQPDQPRFRVSFSDGCSILCDDPHLWIVKNYNDKARNKPWRVMATKDLRRTDLHYGKHGQSRTWHIPMTQPVQFPEQDLLIPPYVLGVLLGDGSLTQAGVNWSKPDPEIAQEVAMEMSGCTVTRREGPTCPIWTLKGSSINRVLKKWGLKVHSHARFIPPGYLQGSPGQRLSLLQGLLDTDGSSSAGTIEYCSTSQPLAQAVVYLTQSMGGTATISCKEQPTYTRQREKRLGRRAWRVFLSLPPEIEPFRLPRKRESYKRPSRGVGRWIDSITPEGFGPTVCISVASPDSSFLAGEFVVTHNSPTIMAAYSILRKRGDARGMIVLGPNVAAQIWTGEGSLLHQWTGETGHEIKTGDKRYPPQEGVVFCSHSKVFRRPYQTWVEERIRTGKWILVIDEAQMISGEVSKRFSAIRSWAHFAPWRWLASGTPVSNYPDSFRGLYSIITRASFDPDAYLRWFKRPDGKYVETHLEDFGKILKRDSLRVTKTEAAPWLPPRTNQVLTVELKGRQRALYDEFVKAGRTMLQNAEKEWAIHARSMFSKLARMTGLATHPGMLGDVCPDGDIAKLETVKDLLNAAGDQKVVIWSWHPWVLDWLQERLPCRSVKYHGQVAENAKREAVRAFNEDPKVRVFLGNPSAAGTALSLGAGSVAIYWDMGWRWVDYFQAGERIDRITRTMPVTQYVILGKGTIEEYMWEKVQLKIDLQALMFGTSGQEFTTRHWTPSEAWRVLNMWGK
jgi:hypothetical protein